MFSLVLLLTISLLLVASCNRCLPILLALPVHLFLRITFAALPKPFRENFGKFQEFGKSSFGGSEKYGCFLKNGSINLFGITSEESWFLIS